MKTKKVRELEAEVAESAGIIQRQRKRLDGLETVQAQQLAQLQDADEQISTLEEELAEARNHQQPVLAGQESGDLFVVVTHADNGVKHAWGPYPTRVKAQSAAQRFKRDAKKEEYSVTTNVLKIISS